MAGGRPCITPPLGTSELNRFPRQGVTVPRANLTLVKTFRLLVLMLLAMLLPLRGLSATTLLCKQVPASHSQLAVHEHGVHSDAAHGEASHEHSDHDHGGVDKSHHCLSACSAPPMTAAAPSVALPALLGAARFPAYAAHVSTFQPDGQERPPRSI